MSETAVSLPRRAVGHLSPSSAKVLAECPRRFEFQKVYGVPEPAGRAAVLGQVVHKAWELLSGESKTQRVRRLALRILDEIWTVLLPTFASEPRHLVPSDPDVVELIGDFRSLGLDEEDRSRFYRQAWAALEYIVGHEQVISGEEVAHRELPLECLVGGVPFKGRVDRIDRTLGDLEILDLKTGKAPLDGAGRVNKWRLADAADQLLLYKPATETVTGQRVVAASLYYVGQSGRGWVPIDLSHEGEAVERFARLWEQLQHYQAAESFPPKPSILCCWCPHFEACPEGSAMVLAQRSYLQAWEAEHGPASNRAVINGWPALRRQEWAQRARDAWPKLQQALAS